MKRDRLIALGVFALGLLFRLPWVLQSRTVRWDESDYLILGRNLLRGDGYQVFGTPDLVWPPGPPALAASAMALGVPLDYALPVWHLLAGALACVVLFYLAREVTGNELVASIAAVLAAVSPALVVWPLYWGSLSESAFLLCWLSGLWASWRVMRDGGKLSAALAGIAFGLAYLIRTEGLFWWALFLLIVIGIAIKKRQSCSVPLLFAAGFLLVALPYVAYLYGHTGRFMLTGKTGINLLISPYISKLGGVGQDYAAALDSTGQEILWLSAEPFDFSYI
ncbi:MAG: glycosyltransferase family 39 protein, partial [Chloroflexota bacterium]|nr:glycosyltransferase family 39 protein [Chloroflexota bacterium]